MQKVQARPENLGQLLVNALSLTRSAGDKVFFLCVGLLRHTPASAQEYLSFLQEIEKNVPKNLEGHIVVDHYATHQHLRVRRWLATRPRFHVHFNPTYASWLNQLEFWFNRITQRAFRRGTFSSVKELVEKIDHYIQNSNRHAQPFVLDCHSGFDLR